MPLKPECYEAIRNLYGRYSIAIDTGDLDALVACFTPDAHYSYDGLPEDLGRNRAHVGHEEIRAVAADIWAGTRGHVLHIQNVQTIEGDGDEAHVYVYGQVLRRGQAPYSGVILTEVSEDTVVRSGDRWVYKSRLAHIDVQPQEAATTSTDVLVLARDEFVNAVLTSYTTT